VSRASRQELGVLVDHSSGALGCGKECRCGVVALAARGSPWQCGGYWLGSGELLLYAGKAKLNTSTASETEIPDPRVAAYSIRS
jgi:hypothetical protein